MISNNLLSIGKPVPEAIIRQFRLRESKEYQEALSKSGKRKLEILWAGIKKRGNEPDVYRPAFVFN